MGLDRFRIHLLDIYSLTYFLYIECISGEKRFAGHWGARKVTGQFMSHWAIEIDVWKYFCPIQVLMGLGAF